MIIFINISKQMCFSLGLTGKLHFYRLLWQKKFHRYRAIVQ
jgi:hypothetical protein